MTNIIFRFLIGIFAWLLICDGVFGQAVVQLSGGLEKLRADNLRNNVQFGSSVSISNDGLLALIGAPLENVGGLYNAGAAYLFSRDNVADPSWSLVVQLVPVGDGEFGAEFGSSVSLSGDGMNALVGARLKDENGTVDAGSAYLFSKDGAGVWSQTQKLVASVQKERAGFGSSVSLSNDGKVALIGAPYEEINVSHGPQARAGVAYLFSEISSGGPFGEPERFFLDVNNASNDLFGSSVSLSANGDVALIGAKTKRSTNEGWAFVFSKSSRSGEWSSHRLDAGDLPDNSFFGESVSLSSDGKKALVGAGASWLTTGSAYLFTFDAGSNTWDKSFQFNARNEAESGGRFGSSVSISGDGQVILIGAPFVDVSVADGGAAYLFTPSSSTTPWIQQKKFIAGNGTDLETNAHFGNSVALSGDGTFSLIGAHWKREGGMSKDGVAYPICSFSPGLSLDKCISAPTPSPTPQPTSSPTSQPSPPPTLPPTFEPTSIPTAAPTPTPTPEPASSLTAAPTTPTPTANPTTSSPSPSLTTPSPPTSIQQTTSTTSNSTVSVESTTSSSSDPASSTKDDSMVIIGAGIGGGVFVLGVLLVCITMWLARKSTPGKRQSKQVSSATGTAMTSTQLQRGVGSRSRSVSRSRLSTHVGGASGGNRSRSNSANHGKRLSKRRTISHSKLNTTNYGSVATTVDTAGGQRSGSTAYDVVPLSPTTESGYSSPPSAGYSSPPSAPYSPLSLSPYSHAPISQYSHATKSSQYTQAPKSSQYTHAPQSQYSTPPLAAYSLSPVAELEQNPHLRPQYTGLGPAPSAGVQIKREQQRWQRQQNAAANVLSVLPGGSPDQLIREVQLAVRQAEVEDQLRDYVQPPAQI